jgi:hypothetical protein
MGILGGFLVKNGFLYKMAAILLIFSVFTYMPSISSGYNTVLAESTDTSEGTDSATAQITNIQTENVQPTDTQAADTQSASEKTAQFSDVPSNSYAYQNIIDLRNLGITNGLGNNKFGYGQPVTRAEFITFLYRLMKWEAVTPAAGSFTDNKDKTKYYYIPVETALAKGVLTKDQASFRPNASATREEMAVMLVRCLGYDSLAIRLDYLGSPFNDVTKNKGYITIAKDFGIITGTGTGFSPNGTALKEQAAAMMMRMYDKLNTPVKDLNAFYAIKSSGQASLIPDLTTISCGWSSLEYDTDNGGAFINTSRTLDGAYKDYYLPEGFSGVVDAERNSGKPALLMVYGSNYDKIEVSSPAASSISTVSKLDYVLKDSVSTDKVISDISSLVTKAERKKSDGTVESAHFDGVVIDFECMKGAELKTEYVIFLKKLREKLPSGSLLYVAVHPAVSRNRTYFDAYDFKEIGNIADRVILMAHDYYTTGPISEADMARGFSGNPLASSEDVYYALKAITDPVTGVADRNKIVLQLSFNWVEWLTKDGKTLKNTCGKYSLDNFMKLFSDYDTSVKYSDVYKSPYLTFTDADGITHTVWYEDSRSVAEKIKMAQMFGLKGISIWRLGNIPDYPSSEAYQDIWGKIKDVTGR